MNKDKKIKTEQKDKDQVEKAKITKKSTYSKKRRLKKLF